MRATPLVTIEPKLDGGASVASGLLEAELKDVYAAA
jgi:hypothetical protein